MTKPLIFRELLNALKRPFTNIKNLVIGLILFNIPLVNLFASGYFLRCIRGTYKGDNTLPDWKNIKMLMTDWLSMFMIGIIYTAIPLLMMVLFFQRIGESLKQIQQASQDISLNNIFTKVLEIVLLVLANKVLLIIIIISFITIYLLIMSYLVANDKKVCGFGFKIILKKALTIKYFLAFIAIMIFQRILSSIISLIPVVGDGISEFLVWTISFTLFAKVYLAISK